MADLVTLSLPFLYRAKYRPPRSGKLFTGTLRDHVLVQVPSVTSPDAPIVLRARSDSHDQQELVYRDYRGRLFVPLGLADAPVSLDDLIRTCEPDAANLRSEWIRQHYPPLNGRNDGHPMFFDRRPEFEERHVQQARGGRVRWGDDDRESASMNALKEFSDGLLIVDGEAWTSIGVVEPYWQIKKGRRGEDREKWLMTLMCPVNGRIPRGVYDFAVDRLADGRAFCESLGGSLQILGRVETEATFVRRRDDVLEAAEGMLDGLQLSGCDALDKEAHKVLGELILLSQLALRDGLDRDGAERAFGLARELVDDGNREFLDWGGAILEAALIRMSYEQSLAPAIVAEDELAIAGMSGL